MQAFGFTRETMQFMLLPLIEQKRDPVGSMGNDSALACLSDQPRMLYDYFKQLFAQVTNPAIDSIREEVIMSLECYIGPEGNLLETGREHAHRLLVPHPILSNEELAALCHIDQHPAVVAWRTKSIDITWPRSEGADGLVKALDRICSEAEQAIDDGYSLIVLSPIAKISEDRIPSRHAARHRCGSSPFGTTDETHTDWHRGRDRGSPRSAPPLLVDWLRRRRDQPVSGFRIALAFAT